MGVLHLYWSYPLDDIDNVALDNFGIGDCVDRIFGAVDDDIAGNKEEHKTDMVKFQEG